MFVFNIKNGSLNKTKSKSAWDSKKRKGSKVQSVLMRLKKYPSIKDARKWLKKNKYKYDKVDASDEYWRFRQIDPKKFKKGSLRTKTLTNDIKIIIGIPK